MRTLAVAHRRALADTRRRTLAVTRRGVRVVQQIGERRLLAALTTVVIAALLEALTTLSAVEVLAIVGVLVLPTLLFEGFWRALVWLRDDGVNRALWGRRQPGWRGRPVLWLVFASLWSLDVLAAAAFFRVPGIRELNPVTTTVYGIAGDPGVLLAGLLYAAVVVAVTRRLRRPADVDFLLAVTLGYVLAALNNYGLLYDVLV